MKPRGGPARNHLSGGRVRRVLVHHPRRVDIDGRRHARPPPAAARPATPHAPHAGSSRPSQPLHQLRLPDPSAPPSLPACPHAPPTLGRYNASSANRPRPPRPVWLLPPLRLSAAPSEIRPPPFPLLPPLAVFLHASPPPLVPRPPRPSGSSSAATAAGRISRAPLAPPGCSRQPAWLSAPPEICSPPHPLPQPPPVFLRLPPPPFWHRDLQQLQQQQQGGSAAPPSPHPLLLPLRLSLAPPEICPPPRPSQPPPSLLPRLPPPPLAPRPPQPSGSSRGSRRKQDALCCFYDVYNEVLKGSGVMVRCLGHVRPPGGSLTCCVASVDP